MDGTANLATLTRRTAWRVAGRLQKQYVMTAQEQTEQSGFNQMLAEDSGHDLLSLASTERSSSLISASVNFPVSTR